MKNQIIAAVSFALLAAGAAMAADMAGMKMYAAAAAGPQMPQANHAVAQSALGKVWMLRKAWMRPLPGSP